MFETLADGYGVKMSHVAIDNICIKISLKLWLMVMAFDSKSNGFESWSCRHSFAWVLKLITNIDLFCYKQ